MSAWRPPSAFGVLLSDRELAQIGLIAALETQVRMLTTTALKAVSNLSYDDWRKLLEKPFEQVLQRLEAAAIGVDETLESYVRALSDGAADTLVLRHQYVHGLFAINEGGESDYAYDWKRLQKVERRDLTDAVAAVAQLTFKAKSCVYRCAELIADGALAERDEGPGPKVRLADRWVRL